MELVEYTEDYRFPAFLAISRHISPKIPFLESKIPQKNLDFWIQDFRQNFQILPIGPENFPGPYLSAQLSESKSEGSRW